MHKHHRLNHFLWRPTTFFPELDVPVKMNELEEVPGPRTDVELPSTSQSNYLLPGSYNENKDAKNKSEVDCQLDLLKRIKHEKERLNNSDNKPVYHFGFKVQLFHSFLNIHKHSSFSAIFATKSRFVEQDGIALPA